MNFERQEAHLRNEQLELLLSEINQLLCDAEIRAAAEYRRNSFPLILIMGAPRSGTTLLMQWLACLGCFSYPTNILSRFYGAPYIGAKIQLMLTKHDFNNEIFDFNPVVPFKSRLGKTHGALAPNEFWYFWRRFFHFGDIQQLSERELSRVDHEAFVGEVAAIEGAFGLPLALKGMIMNWHIPYLARIFDKILFVYSSRHPLFNAQSLLQSRDDYYGDRNAWYSFKPPEYEWLRYKDPYTQAAGQVYFTNRAVEEGLSQVDEARKLFICYEDFCRQPGLFFQLIRDKFERQGCATDRTYSGPDSFSSSNKPHLPDDEVEKITAAYKEFSGEAIAI